MHKAKVFFYVSAGLFLLALSYHLGARNVGAQGSNTLLAMTDYPPLQYTAAAVDQAGQC